MSLSGGPSLVALTTHARDVPALERERFGQRLRNEFGDRALLLETCHRVEAYLKVGSELRGLGEAVPDGGRLLVGEAAIRHAVAVAVGRDSVVVGEDQILHQLREVVDLARRARRLDPDLERLFAVALKAGRRARSWRQGPPLSLADVALASIERRCGPLGGRDVLVVGTGRMGRLATRAAATAGASVAIANRSEPGARSLAATTGARIVAFDPGPGIGAFAAVVVALGGPWPIGPDTVTAVRASATVVVDLSVPAAVPASAAEALGPRLVSADSLALLDPGPGMLRGISVARLEALIDVTAAEFVEWLNGRDGRAAAEALMEHADRDREAELAALWRRLPDLQPDARDAIEGMTRHLARRLLRKPLERLGRDTDGRDGRAVRDIFAL